MLLWPVMTSVSNRDDARLSAKRCAKCGFVKPLGEFHNSKNSTDGKVERCKACRSDDKREYRAKNREKINAQSRQYYQANREAALARQKLAVTPDMARRRYLKHTYGVTPEWFDATLSAQGGACAVCADSNPVGPWQIDHDHNCCPGKRSCGSCIRAILCPRCNVTSGAFEDDPALLRMAAAYVTRTRGFRVVE